ncbi:hypothetical protein JA13_205 [Dickeya phage vB_DsoM_JA13]|uniref:Uncharacterized protein n=1 Tax=Dickeya phage vB_DsoM_JA13 TaxID=2283030 RepID=A0A384ZWI3_9CAUD|nr:hypothetical protein JA13_205 [Dickeya phage vB_DsoM_JA13]
MATVVKAKRKKEISVKVDTRPINLCPELEESATPFRFRGMCPMTRCQYCTTATETGCLALDRKESSDRPISSKEIAYYKRGLFPELGEFDQKQLEATVRRSITRVRLTICLSTYINALDISCKERDFSYNVGTVPSVDFVHAFLEQTFPEYQIWMLQHMGDEQRFAELSSSLAQTEYSLGAALGLTPKKFKIFCFALNSLLEKNK